MRLRPLSLLLSPLWLLIAISLLQACTPTSQPPASIGGGVATAEVITVVPGATTIPGVISGGTLPPAPTLPPPTAIPTLPAASLSPTELKYRVLDRFPDFFFCDPDYYPLARGDEGELALQRFPEIQQNAEEFAAILAHTGLSGLTSFTPDQQVTIYREHKKLAALHFELAGNAYSFQLVSGGEGKDSTLVQGTIDAAGNITIQDRKPTIATCPICLAAGTRIDTPGGLVPVEDLRLGQLVWTQSASGERIAAPVLRLAHVPVDSTHVLVHLRLEDGRELWVSPGHPTSDGRVVARLRAGDVLDGSRLVLAELFAYHGGVTYDLLPAGPAGTYWANGILMGSTLYHK